MVRSLIVIAATTAIVSAAGYETYPEVPKTATYNGFADPLIPKVGPCVQQCLKDNKDTKMTPCPYWDTGCLCIMPMFGDVVANCIASSCVGEEVKQATEAAVEVCSAAGAWDPYWFYGSAQKTALAAAAAKTAEPSSSSAQPTETSAEPQPTEASTDPEPTETSTEPQPTSDVTTEPTVEPTSESPSSSGNGIVAPESDAEPTSNSDPILLIESTTQSQSNTDPILLIESTTQSSTSSDEPILLLSSTTMSSPILLLSSTTLSSPILLLSSTTQSQSAEPTKPSSYTNGTKTITEGKTVTDIVFYCPETTTVTITKCEDVCQETVTVCPPGTVTIYGECVVPEDYTPGHIGDKTVTVPPPGPITQCEECHKPQPTNGKPTQDNQSLAGPSKTTHPTTSVAPSQPPTVDIANAGSRAVAGSLGALAFIALLV